MWWKYNNMWYWYHQFKTGLQKRVKQIPKASAKYRVTTKEGTSKVENYMGECATDYHLHN